MQQYMAKLKNNLRDEGMKFWDIRSGFIQVAVVAGVVGQKKTFL